MRILPGYKYTVETELFERVDILERFGDVLHRHAGPVHHDPCACPACQPRKIYLTEGWYVTDVDAAAAAEAAAGGLNIMSRTLINDGEVLADGLYLLAGLSPFALEEAERVAERTGGEVVSAKARCGYGYGVRCAPL